MLEAEDNIAVKTIPWVDMNDFLHGSSEDKINIATQFGTALEEIGFVAVTHIGLKKQTIDQAYAMAERYFELPEEIKLKNRSVDNHRGFVPFGTEHAKYTDIIDLKEFYQTTGPTQPDELWPSLPNFKSIMLALYDELRNCMSYCLQATAIYLGYNHPTEQTILSDLLGNGEGVMRILHYPPINPLQCPPGAIRSAPHEDLGVMTVIPRATRSGLQVKTRQGEWIDVIVPDGAAIVNSGDTLSYITNNRIPSTTHRVINPPNTDQTHRYSIPFFGGFPFDTVLEVLDKCKQTNNSALKTKVTFGEFLTTRYQEIGLQK